MGSRLPGRRYDPARPTALIIMHTQSDKKAGYRNRFLQDAQPATRSRNRHRQAHLQAKMSAVAKATAIAQTANAPQHGDTNTGPDGAEIYFTHLAVELLTANTTMADVSDGLIAERWWEDSPRCLAYGFSKR